MTPRSGRGKSKKKGKKTKATKKVSQQFSSLNVSFDDIEQTKDGENTNRNKTVKKKGKSKGKKRTKTVD